MRKICSLILIMFGSWVGAIDLELTQGINAAIPVAIEVQNSSAIEVANVIRHDFQFCGQFRIVDQGGAFRNQPWMAWQQLGADHVVTLDVQNISSGRYAVSYQLKDVALRGQTSSTQRFEISENQMRALSHHISDEVYKKLTGVRGVFSTKLAYIKVQRGIQRSQYTLEIADLDGYNPRQLLMSSEPIMSPSWSPDGSSIAYVSFENKRAQIYQVMVATGQRRLITNFPGINGAPAWSPDGREMAVVLSKSGSPKIYTINLSTGAMTQKTFGNSIDTEPRYTPDGRSIVFTSGRGGGPQVYKLSLADGNISRLTYDGNYNARPSMTPNNQDLVLIHRQEDRSFNIGVQHGAGGSIQAITHSSMDESPTVSPNGKLVAYASQIGHQGILGIASIDGQIQIKLPARDGDVQEPAWSPFIG